MPVEVLVDAVKVDSAVVVEEWWWWTVKTELQRRWNNRFRSS